MYDVRRGDVWQLGNHRLMCGDAQSPSHVDDLFGVAIADIVFTSPPYADCRDYMAKIICWDSLMIGVFRNLPIHAHTQLLINLGVIYRKNECVFYWWKWLQEMKAMGWRHYGMYVWDKLMSMHGHFHGRLRPAHEFVFHFNKETINANKWQKSKHAGHDRKYRNEVRSADGIPRRGRKLPVAVCKVADSVIRSLPLRVHEATGHPAQFPTNFVQQVLSSWGNSNSVCYDPFCGSGTMIMACETIGRIAYGMEIAPEYCEMALARWHKAYPDQKPVRVIDGDR